MCDSPAPLFYRHLQMTLNTLERIDFADNLSRGTELVGHSNVQMEWEINPQDGD